MTTKDIVYIALFAAITAAFGMIPQINLAPSVPISLQILGVMLAGAVLGAWRGALSVLLLLLLVAAGLPLLTGGSGGLAAFQKPTAGFLLSWPVAAFVIGFLIERFWTRLTVPLAFALICIPSILIIYAAGIPWLSRSTGMSLLAATKAMLVFIPIDMVKALLAAVVAVTVKRSYPMIRPSRRVTV